jgi:tetratricopeptide (TPR) repeat protein
MVLVYGVGFVYLGVGSGGLDLGQLVRDVFGSKGSSGTSISKARDEVAKHPREAVAYKKLADALSRKGQTDEAISQLEQYMKLAPKDKTQLARLGGLELNQAQTLLTQAGGAAVAAQSAQAGSSLGVTPTGKFGQALGTDPVQQAVSGNVTAAQQAALTSYQSAATRTLATFTRLAKLSPGESSEFSLAQTAEQLGIGNLRLGQTSGLTQIQTAVKAYKKLLTIVTDPATKAQIRAKIKTLAPTATSTKPKKHARKKAGG